MITYKTKMVVRPEFTEFGYDENKDEFYCPPKDETYLHLYLSDLVLVHEGIKSSTFHDDLRMMRDMGFGG